MAGTRVTFMDTLEEQLTVHTTQAFDGIIHYTLEGSFLYYSMFGRQVVTSPGPMAQMCTSHRHSG